MDTLLPDDFANSGFHARRVTATPPEMFQVIGERGSGTNVVRKLIQKNIDLFRTEALGWKHGFPRMLAVPENLLTIVCIRDARDWALSMHKRPWHGDPSLQYLTFSEFIRAPWKGKVDRIEDFETVHPELDADGAELQFDRHPITGRRFPNLFALRRTKLQAHLSMLIRGGDVAVLRMESFLTDPDASLTRLCDRFALTRKPGNFRPVKERMGTRFNSSTQGTPRPETPDHMSAEDVAFMKSQLDLNDEAMLGYVY